MENYLTTAELTNLWNSYMANTMAVEVTTYFGTANDANVVRILESANMEIIKEFLRSFIQITSSKKLDNHFKCGFIGKGKFAKTTYMGK
ncbi:hypothetical protein [Halobacillus seohaensis]|uniref:Uncharacterized protein n=1 Tax=Halobacillus seohaensis TaxID=447421 RepID=A0ABW2EIG7_9BACI